MALQALGETSGHSSRLHGIVIVIVVHECPLGPFPFPTSIATHDVSQIIIRRLIRDSPLHTIFVVFFGTLPSDGEDALLRIGSDGIGGLVNGLVFLVTM